MCALIAYILARLAVNYSIAVC